MLPGEASAWESEGSVFAAIWPGGSEALAPESGSTSQEGVSAASPEEDLLEETGTPWRMNKSEGEFPARNDREAAVCVEW
jgi:hypothetical protein